MKTHIKRRIKGRLGVVKKSVRRALAQTIYAVPPFSDRNPRRRITTFKEDCHRISRWPDESSSSDRAWYLPVLPPEPVQRKPALSLDEAELARFRAGALRYQYGEFFEIPEVFLACISDARVYSNDFLVLSPDNRIFFESALSRKDLLEANGILDSVCWPKAKKSYPVGCLLSQNSPRAYYHWIIEVLPKLMLLETFPQLDQVPLILCDPLAPFQQEALEMAGVPPERILGFDKDCWRFERLYFPMPLGPTGSPSPRAVRWLRERFLPKGSSVVSGPKRIYLTRRDAPGRRVLNEEQVIALLSSRGFTVVCPGELSFAEQIELFRGVEVVVAAHGAAVTNILFAQPGATLVELFGDNYVNGCFWALANICGHRYSFLTGPSQHFDYSIPVDRLATLLDRIGEA